MRPEDTRPSTNLSVPSRANAPEPSYRQKPAPSTSQAAAADVVRSQIDAIYGNDPHHTQPATEQKPDPDQTTTAPAAPTPTQQPTVQPGPGAINIQAANQQADPENPYQRSSSQTRQVNTADWQKYHSAWQSYYQQYYERYYVGHVHEVKKNLESGAKVPSTQPESISANDAMYDLRTKLRNQINTRAQKVRKSRHFIPAMAGVMVMLVFLFLQYNRTVFATVDAYITPSNLDPSTLIIDPNASLEVTDEPKLLIPKIGVDVPIVWDANAASEASLNAAMDKGVAWFNIKGANARPGENGNFVVSGHSSNDWLDQGDYKFIFARLEHLREGDAVYANYNGTRYTYTVTGTKVVKPTDVSALYTGTDKPHMTLITCTPLGTALNRLLVFADQVSPDPASATATSAAPTTGGNASQMPANSPTFLERIFGLGQ